MSNLSAGLKPPMKTLRRKRALFLLLLRTAAASAVIVCCALYYINEAVLPELNKPPAPRPAPAARSAPATPAPPQAPAAARPADPLALVKTGRLAAAAARPEPAARPRLRPATFGGSGGNFSSAFQAEPAPAGGAAAPAARDRSGEAVLLPPSALDRKIKLKGLAPVPETAARRYSGVDREAEKLREDMKARAEAAGAEDARLHRRKLILLSMLFPLTLLVMLTGSRVLKALRLLEKPEGAHWTLK